MCLFVCFLASGYKSSVHIYSGKHRRRFSEIVNRRTTHRKRSSTEAPDLPTSHSMTSLPVGGSHKPELKKASSSKRVLSRKETLGQRQVNKIMSEVTSGLLDGMEEDIMKLMGPEK